MTPVSNHHIPAPFSLAGRRAIVTGGSRGIGAAVAHYLADLGADVGIGYQSRAADAERLVAALQAKGVRAFALAGDLGDPAAADALVAEAVRVFGGLDIAVHNAGIWPTDDVPVHEMTDARWRRTMRANTDAMFHVARAAARVIGDGGRIVHVADYAASKGAMISFVKSQAIELAKRGITVNAVAPGWVDTEMSAIPYAGEGKARIAASIPNGRIATAEDVAWAVVALCMPGARHLVGEIVNVNGGSVLPG